MVHFALKENDGTFGWNGRLETGRQGHWMS